MYGGFDLLDHSLLVCCMEKVLELYSYAKLHKEDLPLRFLLLVFVDKTTAQPYPYAFL